MKIISPFKDYYDYAICPCYNDEIIWNRTLNLAVKIQGQKKEEKTKNYRFSYSTPTVYSVPDEIWDRIHKTEKNIIEHVIEGEEILIVGEKVISSMNIKTIDEEKVFRFLFNGEYFEVYECKIGEKISDYSFELIDTVEVFKSKNEVKQWLKLQGIKIKERLNDILYAEDIEFLTDIYIKERLEGIKKEIRKEFGDVPLIEVVKNSSINIVRITLNPELKKRSWSKFLSPVFVYQEIDMFLNKLYLNERVVEVDNNDKIVANGFDSKCSFKKCKE